MLNVAKQKSEKRGNFQKHPPNKNKVSLVDSDDEHYAFIVNAEKQSCISVTIGGVQTDMIIDSGATCNLISRLEWERLKNFKMKCDSRKCTKKLFAYGSKTPLNVAGSFTAEISVGKTTHVAEFIVVEGGIQNLLGKDTALLLNVLRLGPELSEYVNSISRQDLLHQFRDVFSGLGKLKNFQLEIPIDNTVKPVAQSVRPVPFSIRLEEKSTRNFRSC
ncbi:uncharacterized protein LOC134232175 [Saccostrea cucullata]|uniref:uncharacterized protein LOC134232175 n=1 Tax=Saccostrea cuccullata TaxID=36930 RepID=UPI002ED03CC1